MNKRFAKTALSLLLLGSAQANLIGSTAAADAEILSFENQAQIQHVSATKSAFRQSDTLSMLGSHSLQWDWQSGAQLELPLYNYKAPEALLSSFPQTQCLVIWIYNETPSSGHLTLSLGQEGDFPIAAPFYLDFSGWRTAHLPLSQMQGAAPQAGSFTEYSKLQISVPENHPEAAGRFFIDDVYTTLFDARLIAADYQLPYIKCFFSGSAYATQWLNQKVLPAREELHIRPVPLSEAEIKGYRALLQQTAGSFDGKGLSARQYQAALEKFNATGIREVNFQGRSYLQGPYVSLFRGGFRSGRPKALYVQGQKEGRLIPIREFQNILSTLARSYRMSTDAAQRKQLAEKFVLCTRAYLQSGWAAGSNMGKLHHLGYRKRQIEPAFLMMKDTLAEAGLLKEVSQSVNWFAAAYVVNDETDTDPDLDLFNTVLYAHFLATLLHPDEVEGAWHAKRLAAWMSRTFADDRKKGGVRHDGTTWHHWGHYPAYTMGAVDVAVKITNALSEAGFPLSKEGHTALQKAVKTIMLYQQGDRIPRSLSGRHPLTGSLRNFIQADYTETFVNLPPVDPELQQLHAYHTAGGELHGNWTLPYSAMSLHRREDYLAAVRGFSIYSWGSEIYNFNRFGRYQSYGTLDINYRDDSALAYEGYDWNLNPGSTVTYLPLQELESPVPVWMVLGSTRFANGVHDAAQLNGAHGFILDDSRLLNLDPGYDEFFTREQLRARKSTFFMDDMILCLGTGISGQHDNAPVYTVLTQAEWTQAAAAPSVNGRSLTYPAEQQITGPLALFDGRRTGFLIPGDNLKTKVSLKEQISRGDEATFDQDAAPNPDEQNRRRKKETRGDFLSAVIDHGVQPTSARYVYAVFPSVTEEAFLARAEKVKNHPELFYRIISSKDELHAVRDVQSGSETYIFYEAQDMIPHATLHAVSEPCLLILKEDAEDAYEISAALPDLHQPAFSREHKNKRYYSQPHPLILTFEGNWIVETKEAEAVVTSEQIRGQTIITLHTQHGVSHHLNLKAAR